MEATCTHHAGLFATNPQEPCSSHRGPPCPPGKKRFLISYHQVLGKEQGPRNEGAHAIPPSWTHH